MSDELKRVYVGSRIEGLFLKEMLEEKGIGVMTKDAYQSSISAGWVDGLPGDRMRILVNPSNYDEAKNLIDEYINERDKKQSE